MKKGSKQDSKNISSSNNFASVFQNRDFGPFRQAASVISFAGGLSGLLLLLRTRHRPDGAHTAPGHTYGQRHERVTIRGRASSTEFLFSRASPASRSPHLGLQRIPRSPWLATGGSFWGASGARPSTTRLQAALPQFSLTTEESSILCETFHLVE